MIGGNGAIVEVEEKKLGKRKYNKEHKLDGVWIIGGVQRTDVNKNIYTGR